MEGHQSNGKSLDLQQRIFVEMYIFCLVRPLNAVIVPSHMYAKLMVEVNCYMYLVSCSGFKHAAVLSKLYVSTFYGVVLVAVSELSHRFLIL